MYPPQVNNDYAGEGVLLYGLHGTSFYKEKGDCVMKNEFIDYEVGTVLKEIYMDGDESYYIVGSYFIYMNDFDYPEIRPWKFDASCCYVADEQEKEAFLKDLEKNNLIWNEKTGKVERKIQDREEEIIIEFESAANQKCSENEKSLIISAMEWADEHPREGLVDIDKACEWLKGLFGQYEELTDYNPMEDFIKAMEE